MFVPATYICFPGKYNVMYNFIYLFMIFDSFFHSRSTQKPVFSVFFFDKKPVFSYYAAIAYGL